MDPKQRLPEQQPPGSNPLIVVLCAGGPLAWIMINALQQQFGSVVVLEEQPESKAQFIRRRARMLGWASVLGQIAFGIVMKLMHRTSAVRKAEIVRAYGLDPQPSSAVPHYAIESVNSDLCRSTLQRVKPAIVVVIGTRILREETLQCIDAPFINYHAGINPKYRGMNGGYWALAEDDRAHAGVTVHLVDEGVDTGGILYTATFEPTPRDNFVTYFYLQAAVGVPIAIRAVADALHKRLAPQSSSLPSKQWFHPTLWRYVRIGLTKGVW